MLYIIKQQTRPEDSGAPSASHFRVETPYIYQKYGGTHVQIMS